MSGSKPTSDESRKIVEAFGNLLVDRLKNRTTEFGQANVRLAIEVVLSSAEVRIADRVKALEQAISGPLAKLATIVPVFVRGVVRDAVRNEPVSACYT